MYVWVIIHFNVMNVIMGLNRVEKKFFGKNFCMMFEMLQASGDWSDAIMLLSGTWADFCWWVVRNGWFYNFIVSHGDHTTVATLSTNCLVCWGFLSFIVESLPHNINHMFVVIWHYINEAELNWINRLFPPHSHSNGCIGTTVYHAHWRCLGLNH